MRTRLLTLVAVPATTLALVVTSALPSAARPGSTGDETSSGYEVSVNVTLSGDGAPGDGGDSGVGYTISVPPVCWWSSTWSDGVDGSDPEAVLAWVEEQWSGGHYSGADWVRMLGSLEDLEALVEDFPEGESFYYIRCQGEHSNQDMADLAIRGGDEYPIILETFPTGNPPEPSVDPEDLAIEARELLEIDPPEVDHNPDAPGLGGGTMVNLPTWFWVTDPDMVGGDGQLTIRAQVDGSPVFAEVTAETDGLSIEAPQSSGSGVCEPAVAQQAWSPGADDDAGCTVAFERPSVGYAGGFPVTASTLWQATWEGQTQAGEVVGGDLDPLAEETTIEVPVAEIQGLVRTSG